jgi:hypothetical protein
LKLFERQAVVLGWVWVPDGHSVSATNAPLPVEQIYAMPVEFADLE